MLHLVVLALSDNLEQDFLGSLYHHLELHQEQKGQFFTPYHICEFMSEIQFTDSEADEMLKERRYISVNVHACGGCDLLIAFSNVECLLGIYYE